MEKIVKNLKVNKNFNHIIMLSIVFANRPVYISMVPFLDVIFTLGCIGSGIMLLFQIKEKLFLDIKKINIKSPILWLITWLIYLYIVTIFNNPDVILLLTSRVVVMSFSYIAFTSIKYSEDKRHLLVNVRKYLIYYLMLDNITTIIPIGRYMFGLNYSLIGTDNFGTFSIIIMLALIFEISTFLNGKLTYGDKLIYILALGMKLYTFSVTALVTITLYGVYLFSNIAEIRRCIDRYLFIIVNSMSIIVVALASNRFIAEMLSKILLIVGIDKGTTLSYRGVIWPNLLEVMKGDWIFGKGFYNNLNFEFQYSIGLNEFDKAANHAHNILLELYYISGIVGTLLFIFICYKIFMENLKMKACNYLNIGLSFYFMAGIFDGYIDVNMFYAMVAIMINYRRVFEPTYENQQNMQK